MRPPVRSHGAQSVRGTLAMRRPKRSVDSRQSFLVYLPDLHIRVTVAFWTSLHLASSSAVYALYQVSVRQATILLSLPLAYISRCKPWESLWGSSATTPLVDFHHRLTACPSYQKTIRIAPRNPDCSPSVFETLLAEIFKKENAKGFIQNHSAPFLTFDYAVYAEC